MDLKLITRDEWDQYQERHTALDTKLTTHEQARQADVASLKQADSTLKSAADQLAGRVTKAETTITAMVKFDGEVFERLKGLDASVVSLKAVDTALAQKDNATELRVANIEKALPTYATTSATQAADAVLSARLRQVEDATPQLRNEVITLQTRCDSLKRANDDLAAVVNKLESSLTALTDRLTKLEQPVPKPDSPPVIPTEPQQ